MVFAIHGVISYLVLKMYFIRNDLIKYFRLTFVCHFICQAKEFAIASEHCYRKLLTSMYLSSFKLAIEDVFSFCCDK